MSKKYISPHEKLPQVADTRFEEKRSGKASSIIMASGTLISNILGFIKLGLTLFILGSSTDISDSFTLANAAPSLLYILIGGGALNSILVPQIVKAAKARDQGELFINKLLTIAVLVMGGGTFLLMLFSPQLVQAFGAQWSLERKEITLLFLIWCLPQIFFYGLYTIFGQVLNARSVYGPYMWSPILNNIIAISGLLVFYCMFGTLAHDSQAIKHWDTTKTMILLGTTTLGIIAQALVLIWPVKKLGYRLYPSFGWKGMGFKETSHVAIWALALVAINQVTFFIVLWIAGNASNRRNDYDPPTLVGGSATYNAAASFTEVPHVIITVALATVVFTRMSHAAEVNNLASIRTTLSQAQRIISVVTFFSCALFIVLSGQIGMVVGGQDQTAGLTMGKVIISLATHIPLLSINYMFQRTFYAMKDSKTPFLIQLPVTFSVIIIALLCSLLPPPYILIGLGLNGCITLVLAIWLDVYYLKKTLNYLHGPHMIRTFVRVTVASIVSALIGTAVLAILGGFNLDGFPWSGRLQAFITCIPVALSMTLSYIICLYFMHVEEFEEIVGPLAVKLGFKHQVIRKKRLLRK